MRVQAVAKGVRIAPRKMSLVAALVRGRNLNDALTILQHTPKKAAPLLAGVLNSAAANARHNHHANVDSLVVEELQIGHGPRMKRYFTAARGSARQYMKRTSHVRVVVSAPDKTSSTQKVVRSTANADKTAKKRVDQKNE